MKEFTAHISNILIKIIINQRWILRLLDQEPEELYYALLSMLLHFVLFIPFEVIFFHKNYYFVHSHSNNYHLHFRYLKFKFAFPVNATWFFRITIFYTRKNTDIFILFLVMYTNLLVKLETIFITCTKHKHPINIIYHILKLVCIFCDWFPSQLKKKNSW